MPLHSDFQKILNNYVKQYGSKKGKSVFYAWLNKHGYDDTKAFPGKKMDKKTINNFEFKTSNQNVNIDEEKGIVSGFIATTHPDNSKDVSRGKDGDILTVGFLQKIVDKINSTNPQDQSAKGVSVLHDWVYEANIHKPVAGTTIKAELRDMDKGHKGVWVDDQLDKHFDSTDMNGKSINYEIVSDRVKTRIYPGFSIEMNNARGNLEQKGDKIYRIVEDAEYIGHGFGGIRDTSNPFAQIEGLKTINNIKNKNEVEVKMTEEKKPVDAPAEGTEGAEKPAEKADDNAEDKPKEETKDEETKEEKTKKEVPKNVEVKTNAGFVSEVIDAMKIELKVLPAGNMPMNNGNFDVAGTEVKQVTDYFKALDQDNTEVKLRAANALVDKYPDIAERSYGGKMSELKQKPKTWGVALDGMGIECKTIEVKALTTTTNAEATYFQASAELNDIYDPVIHSHINDQITTYNMMKKDDYSNRAKIQFRVFTSGPTAAFQLEGADISTATNSTRVKFELDWAYVYSTVEVTGQMIADAQGQGGIGDVYGQEVSRAAIEVVRLINSTLLTGSDATYDGEAGSANGRFLGMQHLLDDDSGDNLYGKSRSTYPTLQSAGNDALGAKNFTFHKLRSILTSCETNGANRGDMTFIFPPAQRDKFLQILQTMGQQQQPTAAIAGFRGLTYELDMIPIWVDKDMTSTDIFLIDRENTRIAIKVAPTMTQFGITGDSQKAFIKTYLNLYCRAPNHNYKLTGVKAT